MTLQFDHTIVKINKDGHIVMGHSLSKGEKLIGGDTYEEVKERVGDQTIGIPAALETVTVEVPSLTADHTLTSTVPGEAPVEVEQTGVVSPDNTDPEVGSGEKLGAADYDKDKTGERPGDDAPKAEWFEYALGRGHKGEYDDITKKQLIEQYGA